MAPLHAELVRAPGATPERWAFVLHGIFGAGKNWLSFVRRLAALRPEWGFVLPDLRGHGQSQGAPRPHDLEAAADDLVALASALGIGSVRAAIGHSFGGKVALVFGRSQPLDAVWVLDSNPGTRREVATSETHRVLAMLEGLPPRFATRADFTREVERQGFSSAVAAWLAMSVRPADGGHRLVLDLPTIRALLDDFFCVDAWRELARTDRHSHLVVAGRSFVWDAEDARTIAALEAGNSAFEVHRFPQAGHWVHVDAAEALLELLARRL